MMDRAEFEAWAVREHFAVHRRGGEQYVNLATQHAWLAWQASRQQALEEEKPARLKAWETAWDACHKQTIEECRVLCVWISDDWENAGMKDKASAGTYLAEAIRNLTTTKGPTP